MLIELPVFLKASSCRGVADVCVHLDIKVVAETPLPASSLGTRKLSNLHPIESKLLAKRRLDFSLTTIPFL